MARGPERQGHATSMSPGRKELVSPDNRAADQRGRGQEFLRGCLSTDICVTASASRLLRKRRNDQGGAQGGGTGQTHLSLDVDIEAHLCVWGEGRNPSGAGERSPDPPNRSQPKGKPNKIKAVVIQKAVDQDRQRFKTGRGSRSAVDQNGTSSPATSAATR